MNQPHKVRALKSVIAASHTMCPAAALLGPATKQRRVAATIGAEPQYIVYDPKERSRRRHVIWKPHGRGRLRGQLATSEGVSKCYCERRMCAALKRHGSRMDLLVTRSSAKPKKRARPVSP